MTQAQTTQLPTAAPQQTPQDKQDLAKRQEAAVTRIGFGDGGLQLGTFGDLWNFASCVAASGLAPKGMDKREQIVIAIQTGAELGLTPMQSIQTIAVINGRPCIWGDTPLALVRHSGLLEYIIEKHEGKGDELQAVCTVKRRGQPEHVQRFGVAHAKKAGLWGKSGPWSQYPDRMMALRARGFALRDQFGDVLKGLASEFDPAEVIDTVATTSPDGRTVHASRSDQLLDQLAAMQEGQNPNVRETVIVPPDQQQEQAEPSPQAEAEPPAPEQQEQSQPTDPVEQIISALCDRQDIPPEVAAKVLDEHCARIFKRPLKRLAEKQLAELRDHVANDQVRVDA